eukprot:gb/GFBE01078577.1/.p1 GENE.gb/GFBE01078577.1/~~gb/GFBE01078577.1/.p1  ORF type:complete len:137 (+),score=39.27 gb/GFBE01078577.1/:1-411(+)
MPLEGSAEMVVWRQAVDKELRLASQWEDSWGFLKGQHVAKAMGENSEAKDGKKVVALPPLQSDTLSSAATTVSSKGAASTAASAEGAAPVTPRIFKHVATTKQAFAWKPSIERFNTKWHGKRRNHDLWPSVVPKAN